MTARYAKNRARREVAREIDLMGESLGSFHARERGDAPAITARRATCKATPDMFTGLRHGKTTLDLFDQEPRK